MSFLDYGEVLKRVGAQLQEAGVLLNTDKDEEARMLAEDAYNSLAELFDSGILP